MNKILLTTLFLLNFSNVNATEIELSTQERNSLSIAIYNQDLALVNDNRNANLIKGINEIAFLDVSALIQPETALVKGKGFYTKEQNFNFDLLTYDNLLEKSVGQKVMLEYINSGNGDKIVEYGYVLSNVGGSLVLKIGDRIEANYPGRVIFLDIPKSLRAKPTLTLTIEANTTAKTPINLSYLTRGLSWKADYIAELNNDETQLNIKGLVTLTNTSGVDYNNANMQLIAGNVNQVQPIMYKAARTNNLMQIKEMAYDSMGAAPIREAFMDFYLYSMPEKINIKEKQTKQISLLSGSAKVEKDYTYTNLFNLYNDSHAVNEFKKINPQVKLNFTNNSTQGLGVPLPAGVLRVYKADSNGLMLFAGEDNIKHTPKNEKVKINLGDAFDVTAEGKRITFKSMGSKAFEAEYELIIKNAKDNNITVNVYQYLPNGAEIITENIKSSKENSNQVLWKVPVNKNSETKLKIKIKVINV